MDFIDQIRQIAESIPKHREHIQTEEATKNALVMPFINALGYNVFDPREVVPEMVADIGAKRGEKVDYAVKIDGEPIILFECKVLGVSLDAHNSQLFRYFHCVPSAKIGVLTDGVTYQFYSDLESENRMDTTPFLTIDLQDLQEDLIDELKRMTKSAFDLDQMLSAAVELKYSREIKRILNDELAHPSDDFIYFFAKRVHQGSITQAVREKFAPIVSGAYKQFISDRVKSRLKIALDKESVASVSNEEIENEAGEIEPEERGIHTTEEELEAYRIVRAIVREVVDVSRIQHRDTKSYFGILLDDTNRKPICRLHFNSERRKYIGLFDEQKTENRILINCLEDIYQHAEALKETALNYDRKNGYGDSSTPALEQALESTLELEDNPVISAE